MKLYILVFQCSKTTLPSKLTAGIYPRSPSETRLSFKRSSQPSPPLLAAELLKRKIIKPIKLKIYASKRMLTVARKDSSLSKDFRPTLRKIFLILTCSLIWKRMAFAKLGCFQTDRTLLFEKSGPPRPAQRVNKTQLPPRIQA